MASYVEVNETCEVFRKIVLAESVTSSIPLPCFPSLLKCLRRRKITSSSTLSDLQALKKMKIKQIRYSSIRTREKRKEKEGGTYLKSTWSASMKSP